MSYQNMQQCYLHLGNTFLSTNSVLSLGTLHACPTTWCRWPCARVARHGGASFSSQRFHFMTDALEGPKGGKRNSENTMAKAMASAHWIMILDGCDWPWTRCSGRLGGDLTALRKQSLHRRALDTLHACVTTWCRWPCARGGHLG